MLQFVDDFAQTEVIDGVERTAATTAGKSGPAIGHHQDFYRGSPEKMSLQQIKLLEFLIA